MNTKKIMLIGRTESGKTTLINHLLYGTSEDCKTQCIEFRENFIDTPGEFLEQPSFYKALLVTSYDTDLIIFVEDILEENSIFPPNFSSAFNKEVIGVITKTDLEGDIEKIKSSLKSAGVEKIFPVSCKDDNSIKKLKNYLEK